MSRIPLIHQEGSLKIYFPGSTINRTGDESITWKHYLTPSPLSKTYNVKLKYSKEKGISFYVTGEKLKLAEGETKLPHVYSTEKQELCLYDPKSREWNPGMYYVQTIIPWASEWLYYYEIWLATGKWYGRGIEHQIEETK